VVFDCETDAMQPKTMTSQSVFTQPAPAVTAFICVNAARPGYEPSSRRRPPDLPSFAWPIPVTEVHVPCSGRIQPEHLLKAFENGADAVCVIACQEGNCHHVEGCRRAGRRVEYVGRLLDEIGLGAQRLMLYHLPGSAREDMALGVATPAGQTAGLETAVKALVDEVAARVRRLPPNLMPGPGETPPPPEETYEVEQPEEESDE
jgi:F420-non-reducing hydrogenase iron-sulfur subunit